MTARLGLDGVIAVSMILAAGSALAQEPATYAFRLTASKSNVGTCKALDANMSRVHTLTVSGDKAVIASSGGVDDDMKAAGAGIYRTDFRLGRVGLVVVANVAKSPRTLVVTEPREGCRWSGEVP